jgi:hypothetical protein
MQRKMMAPCPECYIVSGAFPKYALNAIWLSGHLIKEP